MKRIDAFAYMQEYILDKREIGKKNTADLCSAGKNRLKAYWKEETLKWQQITPEFLDGFIHYLKTEGLQENSINSYISCIRAMYNKAVNIGVTSQSANPFRHLRLHRKETEKRAVPETVIEEIAKLDLKYSPELQLAAALFIFSYLTCGIPFADLARLTWDNVHDDIIIYKRIKTGTLVCIGITPGMKNLLKRYKQKDSKRLFPILPENEKITERRYKNELRKYNSRLKKIGKMLKTPRQLTSYVARHTWATEALKKNIPLAAISQSLGHTSIKTTQLYLASLSQDKLNKANKKVTDKVDKLIRILV